MEIRKGDIKFEGVSFSYPKTNEDAVKNINISICYIQEIKKINTNVNIKDEDSIEVESLLENKDDVEVKTDEEK